MQSIKEHNLKANHNSCTMFTLPKCSVCNLSKNTIWKQITTVQAEACLLSGLYAIYQRTQSESKSQLAPLAWRNVIICMQSIKEHNLKANHNSPSWMKQMFFLYAIYQRTQSESKSQQTAGLHGQHVSVCNLSKNTIWKQITTGVPLSGAPMYLYAIYQRTQSESKSQPG